MTLYKYTIGKNGRNRFIHSKNAESEIDYEKRMRERLLGQVQTLLQSLNQ